jgi:hydroxypyruvate isomerase
MPKFAANLSLLFNELSFLDRFAAARAAHFDAVEFLFPYAFEAEQVAQRLSRYKLELVLHNFPAGDWAAGERGIACDPRRIGEFQDSVELAIEYALDANLQFAARHLKEHGLNLLIEPINDRDVPGYFLTGTRQAAGVIADCGADNLFLQYDIYHMQRMEGDLAETIRAHLPLIRHVQLADVPGRHEPGTGEINFPFLFRLLDELGYDGWIGCEYVPLGDTAAGLGWLPRATAPAS